MKEKINLLNDIYYSDKYISLYLKDEEELFKFEYREKDNIFINKSIKRPIKKIANKIIYDEYYDLESAYGYGGIYTNSQDKIFIKKAFKLYKKKCEKENIIAEFIRFHPFNEFPLFNRKLLDFNIYDRDVVIKELSGDILSSYNSKTRNIIKRACEKVKFQESRDIDKFIKLYNETMKKNKANKFYYFSKNYYENLLRNENIKLYEIEYNKNIVSMGFFMFGDNIGHYHLSANNDTSYKINANYALLHKTFLEAQKRGLKYIMLGGGTTSSREDSLLNFKKKFSKLLKPFYIGGIIFNKEKYEEYINLWQQQSNKDIKYFLKYRLEI